MEIASASFAKDDPIGIALEGLAPADLKKVSAETSRESTEFRFWDSQKTIRKFGVQPALEELPQDAAARHVDISHQDVRLEHQT